MDYKHKAQNGLRGLYMMWKRELEREGEEEKKGVEGEAEEDEITKYSHL